MNDESRDREVPRKSYVLGIFIPTRSVEGDYTSVDTGGLLEQRVSLTDNCAGPHCMGKQTQNDAYQVECACDCACI